MAISFVGAGTIAASTAATAAPWPSGHAAGDLGILFIENASGETSAAPSGWTLIYSGVNDTASNFSAYYRLATSGAEATATIADSGNHQVAKVLAFRGVDQATPLGVNINSTKTTASTTITFPSITTTGTDSVVVFAASNGVDATTNTPGTLTGGTGLTGISATNATQSTSGTGGGFAVAYATKATAGATGNPTMSLATTSQNVNFVIELLAAASSVTAQVRNAANTAWVAGTVWVRNAANNGWVAGTVRPRGNSSNWV